MRNTWDHRSRLTKVELLGEPNRRYSGDEVLVRVPGKEFYLDYSLNMDLPGVFDRSSFVVALDVNRDYICSVVIAN